MTCRWQERKSVWPKTVRRTCLRLSSSKAAAPSRTLSSITGWMGSSEGSVPVVAAAEERRSFPPGVVVP